MAAVRPAGPDPRMMTFLTSLVMDYLSPAIIYRLSSIYLLVPDHPLEELQAVALRVDERRELVALAVVCHRRDERDAARLELGDRRLDFFALDVGHERVLVGALGRQVTDAAAVDHQLGARRVERTPLVQLEELVDRQPDDVAVELERHRPVLDEQVEVADALYAHRRPAIVSRSARKSACC